MQIRILVSLVLLRVGGVRAMTLKEIQEKRIVLLG
ncbi:MAG: hypothetical protein M2R45_01700 [Verrucomicrobia subdivision 3 bacterium]|nr:hypothetical protein [Limisphaerales bacterium]MCS1413439.1 hypothetical protein [Limisphaerales bacterium]